MSASATHPARDLFDSNSAPGLLTRLVLEEYEENPANLPSEGEMRDIYREHGCRNVSRLVEHLEKLRNEGMELAVVGSGSIDLEGATNGPFSPENAARLQDLCIGIYHLDMPSLAWLGYLARAIGKVPRELIPTFDMVCGNIIDIDQRAENMKTVESID